MGGMPATSDDVAAFVQCFADGWRQPAPHAWDTILDQDVRLVQPLLANGRGLRLWHRQVARLLRLAPDLHLEVLRWAAGDAVVFIEFRATGTVGGCPLSWTGVDRFVLAGGKAVERRSFFDPGPLAVQLARHPAAVARLIRAGLSRLVDRSG
jgi:hypothetical protein